VATQKFSRLENNSISRFKISMNSSELVTLRRLLISLKTAPLAVISEAISVHFRFLAAFVTEGDQSPNSRSLLSRRRRTKCSLFSSDHTMMVTVKKSKMGFISNTQENKNLIQYSISFFHISTVPY
jgi:hypothetical protein